MGESTLEIASPPSTEISSDTQDRYNVSIKALRPQTTTLISALLNPPKIFLTDAGLPRDWIGLAQLVGIESERIPNLQCGSDATNKILALWYKADKGATIKTLLSYLEDIDRYDIIDDAKSSIEEDIRVFEQNGKVVEPMEITVDEDFILTTDDMKRAEHGLGPQKYDAFVLFADEDVAFVTELIDKLENQYQLKLCVKDRDLVVGVFEHDSIIKLIAERCNRLVAVFSSAFFQSSSNKFFCNFAQSLGIEQQTRKIIPCLYNHCKLPPELKLYFILDYKRVGLINFWEKLRDSIKTPESTQNQNLHRSASQNTSLTMYENKATPLQCQNDSLKTKKEGVKFNSMTNLNCVKDTVAENQNLDPSSSLSSLNSEVVGDKKRKIKMSWFKKLLVHKNDKCGGNIIQDVPAHRKKGFFMKNIKRKMAVAS